MKKIISFTILFQIVLTLFGQAPLTFKYQAVLRDDHGNIKANAAAAIGNLSGIGWSAEYNCWFS